MAVVKPFDGDDVMTPDGTLRLLAGLDRPDVVLVRGDRKPLPHPGATLAIDRRGKAPDFRYMEDPLPFAIRHSFAGCSDILFQAPSLRCLRRVRPQRLRAGLQPRLASGHRQRLRHYRRHHRLQSAQADEGSLSGNRAQVEHDRNAALVRPAARPSRSSPRPQADGAAARRRSGVEVGEARQRKPLGRWTGPFGFACFRICLGCRATKDGLAPPWRPIGSRARIRLPDRRGRPWRSLKGIAATGRGTVAINLGMILYRPALRRRSFSAAGCSVRNYGSLIIPKDFQRRFDTANLYAGGGIIYYKRDGHGLRGVYDDPSKIDILAIGGSTTNERFIDEKHTWAAVLGQEFRRHGREVVVVNAGVDGHSTIGHLKNFEFWFSMIPDSEGALRTCLRRYQ